MAILSLATNDQQASTETTVMSREIHWPLTDLQASLDRRLNMPPPRMAIYHGGLLASPGALGFAYGLLFPNPGDFLAVGGSGTVTFTWTDNPAATGGYQTQLFTGGVWTDYGAPLAAGATGWSGAQAAGTYLFRLKALTPAVTYSNQSTAVVT